MTIEARLYKGSEAIREIRGEWEAMQRHPNSDYEHFMLVCRLRSYVLAPFAVGLWQNGSCRALIVGRIENVPLQPVIGYTRLPCVSAKVLSLIHEGVLGVLDVHGAEAALELLDTMLVDQDADALIFHSLNETQYPLWDVLRRHRNSGLGLVQPRWAIHHELTLEEEPGFLFRRMSSKSRNTIKRKERILREAFSEKVCWSWHTQINDLASICNLMESIAQSTYQRGLGAGFIDNTETRQRLALFISRGQMRVSLLEIDGVPKAFWLGTIYRGIFHSNALGYTPDMKRFGVGNLMFFRIVDELVREGVERMDFGLGDAHYKERFADNSWREAGAKVFSRTTKGRFLRAYFGAFSFLDEHIRFAVKRVAAYDRIKQAWRARLRK